ncbi:MAG: hypothetical protein Q7S29_03360 [Candidatus Peribacter sp.]|nr:hypothetical protein [Candidatus Peribacter sp.]
MKQLHMIGVLHNDPHGGNQTLRGLETLQPDVVALEWPGEEYEEFASGARITRLRVEADERIREVLTEFCVPHEEYDEAKARRESHFGEIAAAREYAQSSGIPLFTTESSEERIATDERYFRDPQKAANDFRDWLCARYARGEFYDPLLRTEFAPWEYKSFEASLREGITHEEVQRWLESGYLSTGIMNAPRTAFQTNKLVEAVSAAPRHGTIGHVGGLAHLLDNGKATPLNLYQHIRARLLQTAQVHRHSLREFSTERRITNHEDFPTRTPLTVSIGK